MNKTLYVTDLDGTLLDAEARLTDENARIISSLTARGALITCATARTPGTVQQLMAPAHLSVPAIVVTGAAFWTINTSRPHFEDVHYIPLEDVVIIDGLFARFGVTPFIYNVHPEDEASPIHFYFADAQMSDAQRAFAEARSRLKLKRFHHGGEAPAADSRVLYFATGAKDVICALAEEIGRASDCALSCYPDNYTPEAYLLEIFAPGVSKAAAVKRLAERVGAKRIVVFGDNLNDLPMMSVATLSVASPTAFPQVKEAAAVALAPSPTAVADFIAADFAAQSSLSANVYD